MMHGSGNSMGLGAWIVMGTGLTLVALLASVAGTLLLRQLLTLSTARRLKDRS